MVVAINAWIIIAQGKGIINTNSLSLPRHFSCVSRKAELAAVINWFVGLGFINMTSDLYHDILQMGTGDCISLRSVT